MQQLSVMSTVIADHTFNVSAPATTTVTVFDPDSGTLVDGNGTAITIAQVALKPLKYRKVIIANRSASYKLWVVLRKRTAKVASTAEATTNDPSSTRGFVIATEQSVVLDISESIEIRICNNSGGSPTNSEVWCVGGY